MSCVPLPEGEGGKAGREVLATLGVHLVVGAIAAQPEGLQLASRPHHGLL